MYRRSPPRRRPPRSTPLHSRQPAPPRTPAWRPSASLRTGLCVTASIEIREEDRGGRRQGQWTQTGRRSGSKLLHACALTRVLGLARLRVAAVGVRSQARSSAAASLTLRLSSLHHSCRARVRLVCVCRRTPPLLTWGCGTVTCTLHSLPLQLLTTTYRAPALTPSSDPRLNFNPLIQTPKQKKN